MSEKTTQHEANAPLSYNKYLRVADLVALQDRLSEPAHHDELLFITIHQTYELWFKQILHEIDAAIEFINEDRVPAATRAIVRIIEIEKVLVNQTHVLETMSPLSFLGFREHLIPASGFQSTQFREIEFASGLKDHRLAVGFRDDEFAYKRLTARLENDSLHDSFFRLLTRRGFDAPPSESSSNSSDDEATLLRAYGKRTRAALEVLTHFEKFYEEYQLMDALIAHDEQMILWRAHHVQMVERMLGSKRGTGGSEGVGYLRRTLDKKFFPELWEARTYLDTKHGESACPFA